MWFKVETFTDGEKKKQPLLIIAGVHVGQNHWRMLRATLFDKDPSRAKHANAAFEQFGRN